MKTQIPMAEKGRKCPFLNQDMSKVCHKCPLWVNVRGANPNTGEEISHWDCSFAWMPTLLIENSQQMRQAGAATESFRNEMVKAHEENKGLMIYLSEQEKQTKLAAPQMKIIEGS
jgi:hypothetical protein